VHCDVIFCLHFTAILPAITIFNDYKVASTEAYVPQIWGSNWGFCTPNKGYTQIFFRRAVATPPLSVAKGATFSPPELVPILFRPKFNACSYTHARFTLAFCNFVLIVVISDCSNMSDKQFFRCAVVCGLCAGLILVSVGNNTHEHPKSGASRSIRSTLPRIITTSVTQITQTERVGMKSAIKKCSGN